MKIAAAALLTFIHSLALAGPLNPPAGPIASTNKVLADIEPRIAINATNTPGDADSLFKITQPGSYFLTGNVSLVFDARSAIEITNSGVTLDLNGFSVSAVGGLAGVIVTNTAAERIVIRNGSIVSYAQGGIDANVPMVNVDRISVEACGVRGIRVGPQARITDCTVVDCHTNADGIEVGDNSIVDRCIAEGNSGKGIQTSIACTVSNCTAMGNTGDGIDVSASSIVTGCAAYFNTRYGISTFSNCMVTDCSATFNTLDGIYCSSGSTVTGCLASGNTDDGIHINGDCIARGNTCDGNGNGGDGAGIHVSSVDNRIEGNQCTDSDQGILVTAGSNIIIKNTCSGNAINWSIDANNIVGPIIDRTSTASAPISGNSAPDSTGSSHPNANFTY